MWGFYRRRLRKVSEWGNSYAELNNSFKCGCWVDHIFIDTTSTPKDEDRNDRTVIVHPCLKHTGKFFKTSWR